MKYSKKYVIFWLVLSIFFSIFYSYFALEQAFSGKYIIQDDARQHVFWMARFIDPQLYPNDILADYFQEAAPLGYTKLYQVFSLLGIHPFLLHKLLPLALGLVATSYLFFFTLEILPIPLAGFCAATFLNLSLWTRDDLVSGTPVAFAVPLFCSFLYYYITENKVLTLLSMALLGLFYPQCLLVAFGLISLRIFRLHHKMIKFSAEINDYIWLLAAGLLTFLVLLPYVVFPSSFGEVITKSEAQQLPVFQAEGWSSFFSSHPFQYWFCGKRSGILPTDWCRFYRRGLELLPPQLWLCIILPIGLYVLKKFSFSVEPSPKKAIVLLQLAFVSLTLFLLAHGLAFTLHLPNRYTEHTLKIVFAVSAALLLVRFMLSILGKIPPKTQPLLATLWLFFIIIYIPMGYPLLLINEGYEFPSTDYVKGQYPELYQFLENQPKDSLTASLVPETNNLPSFTQRSILVGGSGYALPYHPQFFQEMERRTLDLIQAQYSSEPEKVSEFINRYGIDFWLLDKSAFTQDYIKQDEWLNAFAHQINPQELLSAQTRPFLEKNLNKCAILQADQLILLDANCLLKISSRAFIKKDS
ncbi:hypothetical protein [Gloeothece citriformis]|uniref:hypothetical protein n=1 Tax=Gloeothece citriformis TaxID=2546356 RepID=UPI0012FECAEC|nr:hypothetical protein [Gloeothece citriformis]